MSINWGALTAPCTQLLGGPAVYLPAAGGQVLILGVFDEAFEDVVLDTAGAPMNTQSPVIGVQPGDLPAPPLKNDRVKIVPGLLLPGSSLASLSPAAIAALTAQIVTTGRTYKVKEVRADSHGGAILMLNFTPSAA